jgi:taurine--2-oxoglutarate transaminase
MRRLNLIERSQEMGKYMQQRLLELKDRHKSIGDVRGLGLFWAVELVKNRDIKQPFNSKEDKVGGAPLMVEKVAMEMMKNGVFIQAWISHFVIAPPLIITKDEIDVGIKALDAALAIADAEVA